MCGKVIICALLWEEVKGLLGHWLTYSGFSFLSPPLMAVFSSLSIMGPIISSSFSLSSSWMISISLTGSTVPSTWMISSSSKAPAETRHVVHRYRIPDLFSAGTYQWWQSIKWKQLSSVWIKVVYRTFWPENKHWTNCFSHSFWLKGQQNNNFGLENGVKQLQQHPPPHSDPVTDTYYK